MPRTRERRTRKRLKQIQIFIQECVFYSFSTRRLSANSAPNVWQIVIKTIHSSQKEHDISNPNEPPSHLRTSRAAAADEDVAAAASSLLVAPPLRPQRTRQRQRMLRPHARRSAGAEGLLVRATFEAPEDVQHLAGGRSRLFRRLAGDGLAGVRFSALSGARDPAEAGGFQATMMVVLLLLLEYLLCMFVW